MKRGVLQYLEQQRDRQVTGWLVYLQAACKGHLGRQKYRKLKVSLCLAKYMELQSDSILLSTCPVWQCCTENRYLSTKNNPNRFTF